MPQPSIMKRKRFAARLAARQSRRSDLSPSSVRAQAGAPPAADDGSSIP